MTLCLSGKVSFVTERNSGGTKARCGSARWLLRDRYWLSDGLVADKNRKLPVAALGREVATEAARTPNLKVQFNIMLIIGLM